MRTSSQTLLSSLVLVVTLLSTAQAQPAPAAPQAEPAPAAPVAEPAATPPADPGPSCFPACRDGYLCHEGQCISACNPSCAQGEVCVDGRACVPAGHYYPPMPQQGFAPWPPGPPSTTDVPPPPGAWHPRFHHARVRKPRNYPHYQGYLGLQAGLGGSGELRLSDMRDRSDVYGEERSFDLRNSFGAEAVMEFRLFRYFGVGPGVRFLSARGDNDVGRTNRVDLLVVPTIHIPFSHLEIFVPIPLGLTFGSVPSELAGDSGAGATLGIQPGLIVWLGEGFGLYGQIGVQGHAFSYERPDTNYTFSFGRPTITLGVTLRD